MWVLGFLRFECQAKGRDCLLLKDIAGNEEGESADEDCFADMNMSVICIL